MLQRYVDKVNWMLLTMVQIGSKDSSNWFKSI